MQFFRWQNLKVKTLYGTSVNAVLSQVWHVLCVYSLRSFVKFKVKLGIPLTKILRLLHFHLFERQSLIDLSNPPDK